MLVQSRDPMYIKLSDFGLSKESDYMDTFCGTKTYAAPEIYRSSSESYSKRVDIWSLGVVIFQYGYGLPMPGFGGGVAWCEQIVHKLHDWEPDAMIDILTGSMLVMKPKARASVSICLEQVMHIPIQSSYKQPKYHAAFGSECETTVPYDYGVLEEFEPTIPDDYIAMRDRETIGQTYQQATQIHWPHEYTGHTNSSAERSNRPHESIGQTDRSLRPTFRPDESKEHCSEFPHDSEIEKYIGASITGEPAQRSLAAEVYDPTIRLSTNEFLGFQRTNSLQLNRDFEIQRYTSTKAPHESAALIITEKRKRLQAPSSASSNSSGRRRKRSYASTSVANSQSHCFRDSEIDKYIILNPIAQPSHEAPEATLDLFGEGWLKDAKCVGSSVAELWKSESELSSCTPRKSSSRVSAVVTTQDTNANTTESAFLHRTSIHQGRDPRGQVCSICDGKSLCRACARKNYDNEDLELGSMNNPVSQRVDVSNETVATRRCDVCAERRVKCDRKKPCGACARKGHDCTYHEDLERTWATPGQSTIQDTGFNTYRYRDGYTKFEFKGPNAGHIWMRERDGLLNLSDILRITGKPKFPAGWAYESVSKGPLYHRGRWASQEVTLEFCRQVIPHLEGSIKALLN